MGVDVIRGDMTERLPFADETFMAVLSDPPYGLSFMGKGWDHGVPSAEARLVWWQRAYQETGLSDPKEILAAMKRRKPAPMFDMVEAAET